MKTLTSISHFTGKEQTTLYCIRKKITEHLQPLLIFCFESSVTQSLNRSCFTSKRKFDECTFSCGLLVVLPNNTMPEAEAQAEIKRLTESYGEVNTIVHTIDFVLQQLQRSNFFFSWVRSNAIVLYEKDGILQQFPPAIKNREEYKRQAASFNLERYLEEKIVTILPVATENKQQVLPGKGDTITLVIRVENKEPVIEVITSDKVNISTVCEQA